MAAPPSVAIGRCLVLVGGPGYGPADLGVLGTQIGDPLRIAIGMAPDFVGRAEVRALVGHLLPGLPVAAALADVVAAAVELVRKEAMPVFRPPHHDGAADVSVLVLQLAIARVEDGQPGVGMRLSELAIEEGCAASKGIDPCLLARICVSVDGSAPIQMIRWGSPSW